MSSLFTPEQLRALERNIGTAILDEVEITSVRLLDNGYEATIAYDGTNRRNNIGHVEFRCRRIDGGIEDFVISNITGSNYITTPFRGKQSR